MIDTTLGALDGIPIDIYDGIKLGSLEYSSSGTAYGMIKGLMIGA